MTAAGVNRYPGICACGAQVGAGAGVLLRDGYGRRPRWAVRCLSCARDLAPAAAPRWQGGTVWARPRGRCEDAPCCGCCD